MSSPSFGVIFDVDGVLIDSWEAHFQTWRDAARSHGFDCTEEEFALAFGRTSREVMREMWDPNLTDDQIREFDEKKEAAYRAVIADDFPAMPGARELIQELHRHNIPMAIGSSGPPKNVAVVVEQFEARDIIRTVITGADVKIGKPNPDVFLQAAAGMKLPPEKCVVLEDAPPGIEAALAAGSRCVGVVSRGRTKAELHRAETHVTDLTEVSFAMLAALFDQ